MLADLGARSSRGRGWPAFCAAKPCTLLMCLIAGTAVADTFNWGLLHGTLGLEAGLEYTDNLNNSPDHRVDNIYWLLGPTFNGGFDLPIHLGSTGGEELSLQSGLSFSEKFSLNGNRDQSSFSAPVGVSLYVPISFGQWKLVGTDSFTFRDDALEEAVAINETVTQQFNNRAGVSLSRNFGRASLAFGASRSDVISPSDPDLDNTSYQFSVTPSLLIRENYSLFWRNTYGLVYQVDPIKQDTEGYSSEIGVAGRITPYLIGTLSVGYSHSHLKPKLIGPGKGIFGGIFDPEIIPARDVDGPSSTVALSYAHPLNPNTTYSIVAYNNPGVTAVLKDASISRIYSVGLNVAHRLTPRVTLTPAFTWTHIENIVSTGGGEIVDLYGIHMILTRQIAARLTGRIDYQYQARASNQSNASYDVNRVTVKLTYTF